MITQLAMIIIALLWSGMILGISFLESWIKFKARSLTKPVALDVGRTVFNAFHKVQYFLSVILIMLGWFTHISLRDWLLLLVITFVLAIQGLWLYPILNKRVDQVLAGYKISKSNIHSAYGILEIIKFGSLLYLSIKFIIH